MVASVVNATETDDRSARLLKIFVLRSVAREIGNQSLQEWRVLQQIRDSFNVRDVLVVNFQKLGKGSGIVGPCFEPVGGEGVVGCGVVGVLKSVFRSPRTENRLSNFVFDVVVVRNVDGLRRREKRIRVFSSSAIVVSVVDNLPELDTMFLESLGER